MARSNKILVELIFNLLKSMERNWSTSSTVNEFVEITLL